MHRNGIIYGDLKPSNLLFTEEGRLKLCDFGMSQRLSDLENLSAKGKPLPRRGEWLTMAGGGPSSLAMPSTVGTPYYMAPELFLDRGVHSFASDLWALGIVMHELVEALLVCDLSSLSIVGHWTSTVRLEFLPIPTAVNKGGRSEA